PTAARYGCASTRRSGQACAPSTSCCESAGRPSPRTVPGSSSRRPSPEQPVGLGLGLYLRMVGAAPGRRLITEGFLAVAANEVLPVADLPEFLSRPRGEHRGTLILLPLGHAESYHGYCVLSSDFTHSSTAGRLKRKLLAPI